MNIPLANDEKRRRPITFSFFCIKYTDCIVDTMVEAGTSVPASQGSNAVINAVEKYIYDPRLREVFTRRGVTTLMPVQVEAIKRGLFYRQSLLACAPSGSGKTLVGEMTAAMAVLNRLGKAVYLVLYRALASQKAAEFAKA